MSNTSSPPPELVENPDEAAIEEREKLEGQALGDLGDLELEYEQAEIEVQRLQIKLTTPLNTRRNALTSKISNFWPMVLDTYGPDFDSHVAPQDGPLFTLVTGLNVTRTSPDVEPRDFAIEFTFDPKAGDYFSNTTLTKQFWWRTMDNWSGLVSEPVKIQWVKGKDLTNGETDLAYNEHIASTTSNGKSKKTKFGGKTMEQRMGGAQPSFFTWFAWKGHGRDGPESTEEDEEETDVFQHGDELALTICDDLYPNATKFFIEALQGEGDSENSGSDDGDDDSILELSIDEEDDELDDLEDALGGSSGGVKRHDIVLEGSGSESEGPKKKKVKTG